MRRLTRHALRAAALGLLSVALSHGDARPAHAQGAMGSSELETMQAFLVDGFERAKAWDVSLAEAIPDSAMGWAPSPDVRGFAAQVIHAAGNGFIGQSMFGMDAPPLGDAATLEADKAALVAAVGSGYDWIIEHLRAMSPGDLGVEADMFGRTMPRWRIGLFALEHAMWTRGQLVPYLHAHGVAVPTQRLF